MASSHVNLMSVHHPKIIGL